MPAGGIVSSGLGLLMGVGTAIWGNSQKKKYQRQIDALNAKRPKYQINPEEGDIQNLAESRANQGMGAAARQQLQNNADRNLSTLSNAALMGGADANSIGAIADNTQQAYNQNAIYDDQVRLQNLSNLQNVWARQSANRDKQWQLNENQPWKDQMTGLNQQLTGANNLFMSGLNMAGGSLMSLGRNIAGGGGGGGNSGGGGGGEQQRMSSGGGDGGQQQGDSGGGDAYGGSNLGTGGYTPIMLNSGMGATIPNSSPTNDAQGAFLSNNTNNWQP
jgi:hypothetical protein